LEQPLLTGLKLSTKDLGLRKILEEVKSVVNLAVLCADYLKVERVAYGNK
jgi:hypothetical protein